MPQQDYSERTALIVTAVIVVLLVLGGGAVYLYGKSKLDAVVVEMKTYDKGIREADNRIDMIPGLEDDFRKREASSQQYLQRLPDTIEIDVLLKQISQNAKDAQLRILSLERSRMRLVRKTKGGEEPYEMFTYTLALLGDYGSFVEFVRRVEFEMPRFFALRSFSIKGVNSGLSPGTKDDAFKLEFVTYAFSKKAEPVKAAGPGSKSSAATTPQKPSEKK